MEKKSQRIYKVNKNFIQQKIDGEFIGFDTDVSFLYTLNKTAEIIFKKLKSGFNEEKIILELAKLYDVPASTLKKDVQMIVKDLLKHKIIYSTLSK